MKDKTASVTIGMDEYNELMKAYGQLELLKAAVESLPYSQEANSIKRIFKIGDET